ncbi:Modifier of rudimentary Modr protein [Rutstroemia sp. NJR-2017a BBW]|nr:Modifier of rudimentary Modr protein [Rutstroemia sp. NJR-2017a BBW]
MSSSPATYPAYPPARNSQSFMNNPNTPPPPPPKPSSRDVSRQGTPAAGQSFPRPGETSHPYAAGQDAPRSVLREAPPQIQDPGDQWLPKILQDKSKQDLADALAKPNLLAALTHSSTTAHPSIAASQEPLKAALDENISLATHLVELEARLDHLRASTQAQLLSSHALERQWKQKQTEMDRALAPFSPSSLYQRLGQGVQEQEMMCRALEESFLEGDGVATEKEASDWVRRYRESKKVYYSRRERKERWDEGRVGGWR